MPRVFIPLPFRDLTGDEEIVEVAGRNVRAVIDNLDEQFPGLKSRLLTGGQLKPEICVAVGSSVSSLGLLAPVAEDQEVHFLPIVGGG
jgi:molybdopterin synthase sulfur carrier subunit